MMVKAREHEAATFGAEELTVLARLRGTSRFPGVALERRDRRADEAALQAAQRGLVARGVIRFTPEGVPGVAAVYDDLITVPLAATLVVTVERRATTADTRHLYALPDAAVEHAVAVGGIHRLEPLETVALAQRIFELAGLAPREHAQASPAELTTATFGALRDAMRRGDLSAVIGSVGPDGAAFAAALESFLQWCRVCVLRRDTPTRRAGEVVWVDAGGALWRLSPQAGGGSVVVAPVTARELVDAVLALLPG